MYIFPHNKEWKIEFAKESEEISSVVKCNLELFHIGSTSVEGLVAKDCIDILGVVSDINLVKQFFQKLQGIGYKHKGEYGIKGRQYFSKPERKVHLHIFQSGDPNIERHLKFVKIMRSDTNLVNELNALKLSLHSKYPNDQDSYQREKTDFYARFHN